MRIVRQHGAFVLAERGVRAQTAWQRTRGLLGTESLPEGEAMVLAPCNGVHMLGMRYPLYVVYLDDDDRVLWQGVLRPWRFGPFIRDARRVVELPYALAGRVDVGDIVDFTEEKWN